jgi:hypothetical protein
MGKHVTLIEGSMGSGKTNTAVALVVDKYRENPNIKIFANFHLYGIKSVYRPTFVEIMQLVTQLNIDECTIVIDEAGNEGESRRSMSNATILFTQYINQMRKRKIDLIVIVQNGRFLDWRISAVKDTRILCDFNEDTKYIKLIIKDIKKGKEKIVSYYAPQYWKYYDTFEPPHMQKRIIEKALQEV